MRNQTGLKPQDILVLLKMLSGRLSQKEIADAVGLSQAEVSHAMRRLSLSKLIDSKGEVIRRSALEFIVHGLKYVFPVIPGPVTLGMPTAYSHPGQRSINYDSLDCVVWPHPEGSVRGQSINPIYASAALASKKDPELYELLSLIDMIRMGRAREVKMAAEKLEKRFQGA